MTDTQSRPPLSPRTAFVVHLAADQADAPDRLVGRVEHVKSGVAARFANADELVAFMRLTLATAARGAALAICLLVAGAAWADAALATACCKLSSNRCLAAAQTALTCRVFGGSLLANQRCTVSGCQAAGPTPTRTPTPGGCCVLPTLRQCVGASSPSECASRRGLYLTGAACRLLFCPSDPAATATRTPTATLPPPSATPTTTASATTTATVTATATHTATATNTATATSSATATSTPTATPSATPAFCGSGSPELAVEVNPGLDGNEMVVIPPHPGEPSQCAAQDVVFGGCKLLLPVDGSVTNFFDASGTVDPRACTADQTALSYRWSIFRPVALGSSAYASAGITGWCGPVLTIRPDSLPDLEGTAAVNDPFWRVLLTVIPEPREGEAVTPAPQTVWFRFQYVFTTLTLQASQDCQAVPMGPCPQPQYANALPSTEFPCAD